MKKVIFLIAIAMAGCCAVDDNNVSLTSYRSCIERGQQNLANIKARFERSRDEDAALPKPAHSMGWWQANIDVLSDTMALNSATLKGSTK